VIWLAIRSYGLGLHTMDEVAVLIQVLEEIGWKTVQGSRLVPAVDNQQKPHPRCLYASGLLYGVPRDCFVCSDSHLVMLIGSSEDFTLSEFCDRVKNGEPEPVKAEPKRIVVPERQKCLFED
jgi:hypothetical protein